VVGLCADPELGGVYVAGSGESIAGVPIRSMLGMIVGRLVICSDVRGRS
jgi:hypothetical protein